MSLQPHLIDEFVNSCIFLGICRRRMHVRVKNFKYTRHMTWVFPSTRETESNEFVNFMNNTMTNVINKSLRLILHVNCWSNQGELSGL